MTDAKFRRDKQVVLQMLINVCVTMLFEISFKQSIFKQALGILC